MVYQTPTTGRSQIESISSVLPRLYQTDRIKAGLADCIRHLQKRVVQKLRTPRSRVLSTNLDRFESSSTATDWTTTAGEAVSEVVTRVGREIESNIRRSNLDGSVSASSGTEEDSDTEGTSHSQGGLDDFTNSEDGENSPTDKGDSNDPDTTTESEVTSDGDSSQERGIIYARESDLSSVEDGRNLDGQIEACRETAEREGIELFCEPITDEGETGTNFDREGIRELFVKSQRNVDYVLVDDLSRLGRSAPETLYFIYYMQDTVGVKIMTPRGEINASQIDDLIQATMRSLSNQLATGYRTRASLRSRKTGFVEERNWRSGYKTVPPGYEYDTDSDWIRLKREEVGAVQSMFENFVKTGNYSAVAEKLNQEYGDVLEDPLEGWQVKKHLQRKVYIGEPTLRIDTEHLDENEFTAEDPNLQIVSVELFEEAQEEIESIRDQNSTDEKSLSPEDAVEMFGLLAVLSASPAVVLQCTEPGCDGELRANGQRELDGTFSGHSYECKECGKSRKWPYLSELDEMRKQSDSPEDEDSEEEES